MAAVAAGVASSNANGADEPLPASVLVTRPAELHLTYEALELEGDETLGLAGVGYLVEVGRFLRLGPAAYGAVHGERGGFFTGGLELGATTRVGPVQLDAGMFVGAGGGGSAPQGSGLMLRPYIGVSHAFTQFDLGVGISRVQFPDGDIDSTQAYVSVGVPFDLVTAEGRHAGRSLAIVDSGTEALRATRTHLVATAARYSPEGGVRTTTGAPMDDLHTLGFAYRYEPGDRWFGFVEVAGAGEGASDGYAEALVGAGWSTPILGAPTRLELTAALGGGGGGTVDTGGGGIARASIGLTHHFSPRLTAGVDFGRVVSAGRFEGDRVGVAIGYAVGEVRRGPRGRALAADDRITLQGWEATVAHQTYVEARRKDGSDAGIDLLGIALNRQVGEYGYATGQAYGAYDGDAGGYAVGWLGGGLRYPIGGTAWDIGVEALLGVGGGGGLDVGGGALVQIETGVRYRFARNAAIALEAGGIRSFDGELETPVASVSFIYGFARPELQ